MFKIGNNSSWLKKVLIIPQFKPGGPRRQSTKPVFSLFLPGVDP